MMKLLSLLTIITLVGCAEREKPNGESSPASGYNMVDPVRVGGSRKGADPVTPGSWRQDGKGKQAGVSFVSPDSEPQLRLFCDGRRGMVIDRTGLVPSGETEMMTLRVGDEAQRLAVNPTGEGRTTLRAVIPYSGGLMAALQAGPAPIGVVVGEDAPLSLPPSPLVAITAAECSKA